MIPAATAEKLHTLRRRRPRNRFLRVSLSVLLGLVFWSWMAADLGVEDAFSERRWRNFQRFLSEVTPAPLRAEAAPDASFSAWLGDILGPGGGGIAVVKTLGISVLAIVLAGILSISILPLASRVLAKPSPYLQAGAPPGIGVKMAWAGLRGIVRAVLILTRSVPEVILAVILLAFYESRLWPAVMALAVHNFGILCRLGSEVVENAERTVPEAMRGAGCVRLQILFLGLFPIVLPRFLVFFFYRWETCLRETTALGIIGCATLGAVMREVQARERYDELLVLALLGAAVVFLGDLASALVRRWARLG